MNETAQAPESVVQTRLRMIQDVWDRFMSWIAALSTFDREYFEALGRDAKEYESPPFGGVVTESDVEQAAGRVQHTLVSDLIEHFGLHNLDRATIQSEVDREIQKAGGGIHTFLIMKAVQAKVAVRRLESERVLLRAASTFIPRGDGPPDRLVSGKKLVLRFYCDRDFDGKPQAPYTSDFWEGLTALGKVADIVLSGTAPERARDICLFGQLILAQQTRRGPFTTTYQAGALAIRPYANGRLDLEFKSHQAARDTARFICRNAHEIVAPLFQERWVP